MIRRPDTEPPMPARAKFGRARFHRGSACSRCQPRASGATPGGPSDRCPDGGPLPSTKGQRAWAWNTADQTRALKPGTSPQSLIAPADHRLTIPDHPGSSPASRASKPRAGTSTASRKAAANADRTTTSPPRPDRAKRTPPPPRRPRREPDRRLAPSLVTARASPAAQSPKPVRQRHGTRARGTSDDRAWGTTPEGQRRTAVDQRAERRSGQQHRASRRQGHPHRVRRQAPRRRLRQAAHRDS